MDHGNFLIRGLENVRGEISLSVLTCNLRRAINLLGVPALLAASTADHVIVRIRTGLLGIRGAVRQPHRVVTEIISGSVAISQRSEFARHPDRLEAGDVLVVTMLECTGATPWISRSTACRSAAAISLARPASLSCLRSTP